MSPPAVLLEVKKHRRTELATDQLSQPGGIVVDNGGDVFVTDGLFGDGRLVRVQRLKVFKRHRPSSADPS